MKKIILIFVLTLMLLEEVFSGAGESSCNFLKLDPSSRSKARASSLVASPDDIQSAVYTNPAALPLIRYKNIAFTYNKGAADINYQSMNIGSFIGKGSFLALSGKYLSIANLQKSYDSGEGYQAGQVGDKFSAYSLAIILSYATQLAKNVSYGLNLKMIREKIEEEQATAYALDVGVLYRDLKDRYGVGFCLQNLSDGIRFMKDKTPLPLILKAGIFYRPIDDVVVTLQTDRPKYRDKKINLKIGVECSTLHEQLSLRCGYDFAKQIGNKVSFGIGLKLFNKYIIDYAFIPYNETIGNTSSISINIKF